MGKIGDFLAGIKVLEEVDSPYNGKLTVVKSIGYGPYIKAGGLTQSGGIVTSIWRRVLRRVYKLNNFSWNPKILILGLGGGGIVGVLREFWPKSEITAVDIDKVIVNLGKKYLGLDKDDINIEIKDVEKYLKSAVSVSKSKFDLICVDLYVGDKYPQKFEYKSFALSVKKLLTENGVAVFNRLYYDEKRSESAKFGRMLEGEFSHAEWFYPEANLMFICNK